MARVLVNALADRDTDDILALVARTAGKDSAESYCLAFDAFYQRLSAFPESGSPRPAIGPAVRVGISGPT